MNLLLVLASVFCAATLSIVIIGCVLSRQVLLVWYRARRAPSDDPLYIRMIALAREAGLPETELYFIDSPAINSFSVGSRKNGAVVLTTGAIERLSDDELSSMMIHEIAHVSKGRRLPEIATVLAGVLTTLPVAALWGAVFTGFGQDYDPAPKLIRFFATSIFAPPAALLIQIATPESVRYEADKYAALFCGSDAVIRMLSQIHDQERWDANPSHAALFIADPLTEDEIYNTLFRTRPSIDDRIKRLEEAGY